MNLMIGDGDGLSQIGMLGTTLSAGPRWDSNEILGPDGSPVSSTPPPAPDPMSEVQRLREELHNLKSGYDQQVRSLKTELESTKQQFRTTVESTPTPEPEPEDDWNRQTSWWGVPSPKVQNSTPHNGHPERVSSGATKEMDDMTPEQIKELVRQEREQADRDAQAAYLQRRQKEEEATKQFLSNPSLKPWMNDALREYQFLQQLAPNAPVEAHLQTVMQKINANIGAGLKPQVPFDDRQMQGGGIPGQSHGGVPLVGDKRYRPDEQGSVLGFYSDEDRKADAAEDIRARQMDLEYRKQAPYNGGQGTTYEQFYENRAKQNR